MSDDGLPVVSLEAYRTKRAQGYCSHAEREIDDNRRSVTCAKCGADLDVFACLMQLCRMREHLIFTGKQLADDIKRLSAQKERLKQDVSNAKAQLRRARTTDPG